MPPFPMHSHRPKLLLSIPIILMTLSHAQTVPNFLSVNG